MDGVYFRFDTSGLQNGLQEVMDKVEDKSAIHKIVAITLFDQTVDRFENEKSPDDDKWNGLSPLTFSNRRSGKGILRDSGELLRSIHQKSDSNKAEVGTNLNHPKVWVMQHGAIIRPRRGKYLRIPASKNGYVFSKGVKIPARPYIGIGKDDEEMVREALEGFWGGEAN
ncbi:MAG: phage virion morphogenesis protein [Cohaesibacter sp.]|jgi:phage gpG-like protein|nr:phage virion morphogenesis protein [Cohaesibacter sp.]